MDGCRSGREGFGKIPEGGGELFGGLGSQGDRDFEERTWTDAALLQGRVAPAFETLNLRLLLAVSGDRSALHSGCEDLEVIGKEEVVTYLCFDETGYLTQGT